MSSRVARTAMRVKVRKAAAREERLKAKLDNWVGAPLRQAITANERLITEVANRLQMREVSLMEECRKMQERVATLEVSREAAIKQHVVSILSTYRSNVEEACLNIERGLRDNDRELKQLAESCSREQSKLRKEFKSFSETADRRLETFERTVPDNEAAQEAIRCLKCEFDSYVGNESQRDQFTRRLEYLVKDMEGRNWPWRPHMDRTDRCTSPFAPVSRGTWVPEAVVRDMERSADAGTLRLGSGADSRAGSSSALTRSGTASGAPRPSPPSSRPSSARGRRAPPSPSDRIIGVGTEQTSSGTLSCSAGAAAVGSARAAVVTRSRPQSAR